MPADLSRLMSRMRTETIPGVGEVMVREPTLAESLLASSTQYWWVPCITMPDGSPFLVNPTDMGKVRLDIAQALLEAVLKPGFTEPASAGSTATPAPNNA